MLIWNKIDVLTWGDEGSQANWESTLSIDRLFIYYNKGREKILIIPTYSKCNHHFLSMLSIQECSINTNHRSTILESFNFVSCELPTSYKCWLVELHFRYHLCLPYHPYKKVNYLYEPYIYKCITWYLINNSLLHITVYSSKLICCTSQTDVHWNILHNV